MDAEENKTTSFFDLENEQIQDKLETDISAGYRKEKIIRIKNDNIEIKISKDFDYQKIISDVEKDGIEIMTKTECENSITEKKRNIKGNDDNSDNNKNTLNYHVIGLNQDQDQDQDQDHPSRKIDLHAKTKINKQIDLQKFFKKSRHVFIMSEGGQPIYTRYGDELQNCELLATFSAIMTKFTHFHSTQNTKERIQYIKNEKTVVVFLKKGKMIFIGLSKKQDTISYMISQLEYVYLQLVSIITADRLTRLEENPRNLYNALSDTNELFEQMITYSTKSMACLLNSFQTLLIDFNIRNRLTTICNENRGEALLCVILTPFEIITISKSEMINVSSSDIILIQNLIFSSESLKQTESWVPICLPGISDCGYLQMYINFFEPQFGLVFVTESQEHSYFLKFAEQSRAIYEAAQKENMIAFIKSFVAQRNISSSFINSSINTTKKLPSEVLNNEEKLVEEFFKKLTGKSSSVSPSARESVSSNASNLTNFQKRSSILTNSVTSDPFEEVKFLICKNKITSQFFTFKFNDFNSLLKIEKNVMAYYINLYDIYNTNNLQINPNNFFYYEKSDNMTHTIHSNENYIIFASYSLFEEYDTIFNLSTEILRMIKNRESHYFINKY